MARDADPVAVRGGGVPGREKVRVLESLFEGKKVKLVVVLFCGDMQKTEEEEQEEVEGKSHEESGRGKNERRVWFV